MRPWARLIALGMILFACGPLAAAALPPALDTLAGGGADLLRELGWGLDGILAAVALLLLIGGVRWLHQAPRGALLYPVSPRRLAVGGEIDATFRTLEEE